MSRAWREWARSSMGERLYRPSGPVQRGANRSSCGAARPRGGDPPGREAHAQPDVARVAQVEPDTVVRGSAHAPASLLQAPVRAEGDAQVHDARPPRAQADALVRRREDGGLRGAPR